VTLLDLGRHAVGRRSEKPTAPATEPTARQVVLWVGMSDAVLSPMRDRLPADTLRMLECADSGIPHHVRFGAGPLVALRRIRYDRIPLGYGIVISQWMTIAPKCVRPPEYMKAEIVYARKTLETLGLVPQTHLTDKPSL